jgi:hypothetical protein
MIKLNSRKLKFSLPSKPQYFIISPSKIHLKGLDAKVCRYPLKNFLTVAAAGVVAVLAFSGTPASAAFFFFCGMFADGGKVTGTIQLDDVTGNFISLLNATTTETVGNINPITYTNFTGRSTESADMDNPFSVFRYNFSSGSDILEINYPTSLFPNNFPPIGVPGVTVANKEIRNGTPRLAPFDPVIRVNPPVPGPLPILGAAAAFRISRRIRKKIKARQSLV